MELEDKQEQVKKLLLSTDREGMPALVEYMEKKGFFTSPASTKFHGNYQGGLLDHSINVYNTYRRWCKKFNLDVPSDSQIIIAFLHDLCKAGLYLGNKAPYGFNTFSNAAKNGEHGKNSVKRAEEFIKLTELEKQAIIFHMGIYTKDSTISEVIDAFKDIRVKMFYFADDTTAQLIDEMDGDQ